MSVDIVVLRGAGDKKGPDIIDSLLCEVSVAVERGRNEIDAAYVRHQPIRLTVIFRANLRLGQLVEVVDALQGPVWRGKIVGISHRIESDKAYTVLDILRPFINF